MTWTEGMRDDCSPGPERLHAEARDATGWANVDDFGPVPAKDPCLGEPASFRHNRTPDIIAAEPGFVTAERLSKPARSRKP